MNYKIRFEKIVINKHLPKLSLSVKSRIKKAIDLKLAIDPITYGKPLQYNLYGQRPLKVGDYGVIYTVDSNKHIITIHAIGHRKKTYN